jgi:hypothetical protein
MSNTGANPCLTQSGATSQTFFLDRALFICLLRSVVG